MHAGLLVAQRAPLCGHTSQFPGARLVATPGYGFVSALRIIYGVPDSTLWRVLQGTSDASIRFGDVRALLVRLGFVERIKGSHHIFTREGVADILNLQPRQSFAKAYQVKQVRRVILQYKLAEEG